MLSVAGLLLDFVGALTSATAALTGASRLHGTYGGPAPNPPGRAHEAAGLSVGLGFIALGAVLQALPVLAGMEQPDDPTKIRVVASVVVVVGGIVAAGLFSLLKRELTRRWS